MSKKYDDFLAALKKLCLEHDVQLSGSGYEGIEVWDLKPGGDPVHGDWIDDMTEFPLEQKKHK